jgi:CelD/BcsL family acetyltransferase involved in cellulose biosynthesis
MPDAGCRVGGRRIEKAKVRTDRRRSSDMPEHPQGQVRVETVSTEAAFRGLSKAWDDLVTTMPRPSPFLLSSWLAEWWRHFGGERDLAVLVAFRGERLVAALPLCVSRRLGLGVLEFVGGSEAAPLADLMLARGENSGTAAAIAEHVADSDHDFASLFGLPRDSRLVAALPSDALHLVERLEAPVLDLHEGWEAVYETKVSAKARADRRRRRRQLEGIGALEVSIARTPAELDTALDEAFGLHDLRWRGKRDPSEFGTPTGRSFYRSALLELSERDVSRLVTVRLDRRPIAFALYLQFARTLFGVTTAFDPAYARSAPGSEAIFSSLEAAAAEGIERAEFLGAAADHKRKFTDRSDPIYQGLGFAGTARGRAAVGALAAGIRLRRRAKRSRTAQRLYYRIPRVVSLPKLSSERGPNE